MKNGSRLGLYCDQLIEAGWLTAAILVPLFFNINSMRIFEPDKAGFLRCIAAVMVIAWLIRYLEAPSATPLQALSRFFNKPLIAPALCFLAINFLSAALSLSPHLSFNGSAWRMQGLHTLSACVFIFLILVQGLNNRARLKRLITALILASLPIALFAWLQYLEWDPIRWGEGPPGERVGSNLGNPIFLGAYMVMVFFLTMAQTCCLFGKGKPQTSGRQRLFFLPVLLLQFSVLLISGSRGPLLALAACIFLIGLWLLLQLRHKETKNGPLKVREILTSIVVGTLNLAAVPVILLFSLWPGTRRWLVPAWITAWLMMLILVVQLNRPGHHLDFLKQFQPIGRIGQFAQDLDSGTGTASVRFLIWDTAARLCIGHAALQQPNGRKDIFHFLRPFIGNGQETIHILMNRFYPPGLAQIKGSPAIPFVDRCHNDGFDKLLTIGWAGFLAYQWLLFSIVFLVFRRFGWIEGSRSRHLFLFLWIGCGLCGALLAGWIALSLAAVGWSLGLTLALCLFPMTATWSGRNNSLTISSLLLHGGLLALVWSHYIESQTGIVTVTTRMLFWMSLAILIHAEKWLSGTVENMSPRDSDVLSASEQPSSRKPDETGIDLTGWILISTLIVAILAFIFNTGPQFSKGGLDEALRQTDALNRNLTFLGGILLLWLFSFAWISYHHRKPSGLPRYKDRDAVIVVPALIVCLVFMLLFNFQPLLAAVYQRQGVDHVKTPDWALTFFHRAIKRDPGNDLLYWHLGGALLQKAINMKGNDMPEALPVDIEILKKMSPATIRRFNQAQSFNAAETALQHGQQLAPWNPDHYANLARLYTAMAMNADTTKQRAEYANKVDQYYSQATQLCPLNFLLLNEWAGFHMLTADLTAARQNLERSLGIRADSEQTLLLAGELDLMENRPQDAATAFQKAMDAPPGCEVPCFNGPLDTARKVMAIYIRRQKFEEGLAYARRMANNFPEAFWPHQYIAEMYAWQQRYDEALEAADTALNLCSGDQRKSILKWRRALKRERRLFRRYGKNDSAN